MEKEFVEALDIYDVYQKQESKTRIDIYFTVKNQTYRCVVVKSSDKLFRPFVIDHKSPVNCSFCDVQYANCRSLHPYLLPLFQRLIECPNIRLDWVYLDYDLKVHWMKAAV